MSSLHAITETVGISKRFSPLNIKQSPISNYERKDGKTQDRVERWKKYKRREDGDQESMESRSRKRGKEEEDGEEENIEKRRS